MPIIIVAFLLVVGLLILAASKPATLDVKRTTSIRAPADRVFRLVDDLHNWVRWEPQDPPTAPVKREYSGSASGKGAVCIWEGPGRAGAGRMEVLDSSPPGRIIIQVDFVRPFRAHNINEFTFEVEGDSTSVSWLWHGTNVYVLKLMSVVLDVDKLMGKHFDSALANLKQVAEAPEQ
jgi:uncharacterized protein YndB with AHSA1/START domain